MSIKRSLKYRILRLRVRLLNLLVGLDRLIGPGYSDHTLD